MRTVIKTAFAMAVAAFSAVVLMPLGASDPAFARGGGGGRGGGGAKGGGGGRGATGGGGRGTGPGKGSGKKNAKTGLNGSGSPLDYLEQLQREDADAARPDFVATERFESSRQEASYDRSDALAAEREKASRDRRGASESGSHPL